MAAPTTLGASTLRAAMTTYRDLLVLHQEGINRLNVYPVPDGDTGTNMARTLDAVADELSQLTAEPSMAQVCASVSHGSLMGARGNSGVILSQLLRGVADQLSGSEHAEANGAADGAPGASPADVARAFRTASDLARRAVVRPVEGTILSVADAAADAASAGHEAGESLLEVLEHARSGAAAALARTPEQLPVLASAGVVDAGGTGYLLLFDAMLVALDGRTPSTVGLPRAGDGERRLPSGSGEEPPAAEDLRYEVMYLLEAPDETMEAFREVWAGIGDSIVVVGGDGLWNCHIHTGDIGAAIEAALDAGRPRRIRVTDLLEQVEEERWVREASTGDPAGAHRPTGPAPATAVVAVVSGDGIGRIFRSLGVSSQVRGGQSANPSTAELVAAVEETGCQDVVILPNNRNVRPVADQVGDLCDQQVRIVPTESMVEGFAALLAYDPAAGVSENARAMEASAERVVPGEIARATRDAETDAGPVKEGEWLGISRHRVVCSGPTIVAATCGLLDHLLVDAHELVTLIEGEGSAAADTRRISEWIGETHPDVDLEVHHGGQAVYAYLLGLE